MFCGVYGIFNHNGKVYIGSAVDIYSRFNTHRSLLNRRKHTSIHLQRAWNQDGDRNFDFRIIESVSNKVDLIKREQYWLDKFKSYAGKYGYNILKIAGSSLGHKASKKTKKLLSKAKKGKKFTDEHKRKISKALLGKRKSKQHCINLSHHSRGKLIGKDNPFFGKRHTKKTIRIIKGRFKDWLQTETGKKWSKKMRKRMIKLNKSRAKLVKRLGI